MLAAGIVVIILAGIAAAAYLWSGRRTEGRPDAADRRRIVAVLPFRNISADTAQQYFSAGMTEEITSQLAKVASLRVLGRSATAQYDTVANRLQRMASDLGVGSVVEGSVRLAGDRVRIDVELTDVQSGQSLWSDQYQRQIADIFAVQDDVAIQVTSALQAALTPSEAKRLAQAPTTSPAAHQIYLRALALHPTRPVGKPGPGGTAAPGDRDRHRVSRWRMPIWRATTCSAGSAGSRSGSTRVLSPPVVPLRWTPIWRMGISRWATCSPSA